MSGMRRVLVWLAGLALLVAPGAALIQSSSPAHQQALVCDDFLYHDFRAVQVVCDNYEPLGKL